MSTFFKVRLSGFNQAHVPTLSRPAASVGTLPPPTTHHVYGAAISRRTEGKLKKNAKSRVLTIISGMSSSAWIQARLSTVHTVMGTRHREVCIH